MDALTQSAAVVPIASGAIQQLLEGIGNPLYNVWFKARVSGISVAPLPGAPAAALPASAAPTTDDRKTIFMSVSGLILGVLAAPLVFPHGLFAKNDLSPNIPVLVVPDGADRLSCSAPVQNVANSLVSTPSHGGRRLRPRMLPPPFKRRPGGPE